MIILISTSPPIWHGLAAARPPCTSEPPFSLSPCAAAMVLHVLFFISHGGRRRLEDNYRVGVNHCFAFRPSLSLLVSTRAIGVLLLVIIKAQWSWSVLDQ